MKIIEIYNERMLVDKKEYGNLVSILMAQLLLDWCIDGLGQTNNCGCLMLSIHSVFAYKTCRFSQLFDFESRAHTRPNNPFTFRLAEVRVPRIFRGLKIRIDAQNKDIIE